MTIHISWLSVECCILILVTVSRKDTDMKGIDKANSFIHPLCNIVTNSIFFDGLYIQISAFFLVNG